MFDARRALLASLLFAAPVAAPALADSLVARGLTLDNVTVLGIRGDEIEFSVNNNAPTKRKLADVSKIVITSEPAFSAAEELYARKDYDKATTEYDKVVRSTNKAWLKDFAGIRLLDSAARANRFDAAIKGWLALAEKSPDLARGMVLTMPPANSTYLPEAIKSVEAALNKNPPIATQEALVGMLVDLNEAKGDARAAADAQRRRAEILIKKDPASPEAVRAQQQIKVGKVLADLDAKKYDEAIAAVHAEAANVVDPADTATLLWALAEAQLGKAAAGNATKEAWMDVAVSYMRVVANVPRDNPRAIDALLKVADIHATRLNDKDAARAIYKRMADDYKNHEAGQVAQREMDKLK